MTGPSPSDARFPEVLDCRIGALTRSAKWGLYELDEAPLPDGGSCPFVVHPPKVGFTDVGRAVQYIERTWDAIHAQMPGILAEAVPLATQEILRWYGDQPCPVERISEMLSQGRLEVMGINFDGDHWMYRSGNDVIGHRDVVIYLSGALRITNAHLDG